MIDFSNIDLVVELLQVFAGAFFPPFIVVTFVGLSLMFLAERKDISDLTLKKRTLRRVTGQVSHPKERGWRPFMEDVETMEFSTTTFKVHDIFVCYCADLAQHRYLAQES